MKNISLFIFIVGFFISKGQVPCGYDSYVSDRITKDLISKTIFEQYDIKSVYNQLNLKGQLNEPALFRIPVVVHLIGNSVINKITYNRIKDQINTLNNAFTKKYNTIEYGNGVNTQIEFCLAKIAPNGSFTNGVVEIESDPEIDREHPLEFSNSDLDVTILTTIVHWPADRYLNIYVVTASNNDLLGWATPPAFFETNPDRDGVFINHEAFGRSQRERHDRGHTLVHEVGHWLNLKHLWGGKGEENDCYEDDDVEDTPMRTFNRDISTDYSLWSRGCNAEDDCILENESVFSETRRQVENYMNYSDDLCTNMFTQGQKERMTTCLLTTRQSLWANFESVCSYSTHCTNGIQDFDERGIDCGGSNCPPCFTPGSGGGGNSDLYIACKTGYLETDGFSVNGFRNGVINICENSPIVLSTGYSFSEDCYYGFGDSQVTHKEARSCNNIEEGATICYEGGLLAKCFCVYAKLFVSVTLCSKDLEPIDTEYSKWITFKNPETYTHRNFSGTYYNSDAVRPFDLRTHLPSPYISFVAGQYYRVKLATTNKNNEWVSFTNYIHFSCEDANGDGDCINKFLNGVAEIDKSKGDFNLTTKIENDIPKIGSKINCNADFFVNKFDKVGFINDSNPNGYSIKGSNIQAVICEDNGIDFSGSYFIVGDFNEGNTATLNFRSGSYLRMSDNSSLIIDRNSKMIIEPEATLQLSGINPSIEIRDGAILEIQGNLNLDQIANLNIIGGGTLLLNTNSSYTLNTLQSLSVVNNGTLKIGQHTKLVLSNALSRINLLDENAAIEISGKLHLGIGASLNINPQNNIGYIHLNLADKDFLSAEATSRINLEGVNSSDKVLEITGNADILQSSGLSEFKIKKGLVQFTPNAKFRNDFPDQVNNVVFKSSSGSYQRAEYEIFGQNITFNNCTFDKIIFNPLLQYGAFTLRLNNVSLKNNSQLNVENKGVNINTLFIDNTSSLDLKDGKNYTSYLNNVKCSSCYNNTPINIIDADNNTRINNAVILNAQEGVYLDDAYGTVYIGCSRIVNSEYDNIVAKGGSVDISNFLLAGKNDLSNAYDNNIYIYEDSDLGYELFVENGNNLLYKSHAEENCSYSAIHDCGIFGGDIEYDFMDQRNILRFKNVPENQWYKNQPLNQPIQTYPFNVDNNVFIYDETPKAYQACASINPDLPDLNKTLRDAGKILDNTVSTLFNTLKPVSEIINTAEKLVSDIENLRLDETALDLVNVALNKMPNDVNDDVKRLYVKLYEIATTAIGNIGNIRVNTPAVNQANETYRSVLNKISTKLNIDNESYALLRKVEFSKAFFLAKNNAFEESNEVLEAMLCGVSEKDKIKILHLMEINILNEEIENTLHKGSEFYDRIGAKFADLNDNYEMQKSLVKDTFEIHQYFSPAFLTGLTSVNTYNCFNISDNREEQNQKLINTSLLINNHDLVENEYISELYIYNTSGQLIKQYQFEPHVYERIKQKELERGMYILKFKSNQNNSYTQKLVIK